VLALTVVPGRRPKGFFPAQDTGAIVGISEAPSIVRPWPTANRRSAGHPQDPAVESLSSFIGAGPTRR
jgi:multidrug efflux pump